MRYQPPARYIDANLEKNTFAPELKPAVDYLKSFKSKVEKNWRGNWVMDFSPDSPKQNLILSGGVGVGKTWLIHSFLNYFTQQHGKKALVSTDPKTQEQTFHELDIPIAYMKIKEIIDGIRRDWAEKNDGTTIEHLSTVPLLIIDEVGVNYGTESERIELYELFNFRWENMLPTIVISNLTPAQQASVLGQRIMDRLCDGAIILNLKIASRRNHTESLANK